MCFSACHWAKISMIVYGANIKDAENFGFNELNISNQKLKQAGKSQIKLVGGVLKRENMDLFRKWSFSADRRVY